MMLLKRSTSFWSSLPYEVVGKWVLDKLNSQRRISGSVFTAKEVPSSSPLAPQILKPLLYGVHIVTNDGINWRVILQDKLATSALLSAIKEMHTEMDERNDKLYSVTLALEKEDHWDNEGEGVPEPTREFVGKSPSELRDILRDLRKQYEREGAIVIESEATKVFKMLEREGALALMIPRIVEIVQLKNDADFIHCCVNMIVYGSFEGYEEDMWRVPWKSKVVEYLKDVPPETIFRDNCVLMNFTVKLQAVHAKTYLGLIIKELEKYPEMDFERQCDLLVRCIVSKFSLPSKVEQMLTDLRELIEQEPRVADLGPRGIGAMLLLRLIGPALTNSKLPNRLRLAKFLICLVTRSTNDEQLLELVAKYGEKMAQFVQTLKITGEEANVIEDAFAHESFVADDEDYDINSCIVYLIDKLQKTERASLDKIDPKLAEKIYFSHSHQ
jgi:hypothetical protein